MYFNNYVLETIIIVDKTVQTRKKPGSNWGNKIIITGKYFLKSKLIIENIILS